MNVWQRAGKRALDLSAAATGLLLLGPLMLLVACAVRLNSPGAALFKQARLGRNARPFVAYKFRTMYTGAPDLRNSDGSTFNAAADPRVTRVGRILRQTSLDELPQLFNVLCGDMSLVGPRPDQVDQIAYYTARERGRLAVKPGLTGLAQVNGRNQISWARRKELDLEYVARQTLRLDLALLARTIPYVLLRRDLFVAPPAEEIA